MTRRLCCRRRRWYPQLHRRITEEHKCFPHVFVSDAGLRRHDGIANADRRIGKQASRQGLIHHKLRGWAGQSGGRPNRHCPAVGRKHQCFRHALREHVMEKAIEAVHHYKQRHLLFVAQRSCKRIVE